MSGFAWRVIVDPPASGPTNMAVDHALAASARPGEAVFRIYRWSRPTVSFGRNEPARDRYDPAAGREDGIEFVRRPTGGRAVLHDQELTYSVILPIKRRMGLREIYGRINRGLAEALVALGVPAVLAVGRRSPAGLDAGPCFEEPASGEVTVAGRKLIGSAQARLDGALLQHGSLLIGSGQDRLADLGGTASGSHPSISLEEVLGQAPPWTDLVAAIVSGMSGATGGDWQESELREVERVKSREFAELYASSEWTWRR